jgi:hypothetical protein
VESRPPAAAGIFSFGGFQRYVACRLNLKRSAFRRIKFLAKPAKSANAPRYRSFSAEIELSFALSSLRYPAYPVASGSAGVRGPAAR